MSGNTSILVVDDEAVVRSSCERILTDYRVSAAASGEEALGKLEQDHFDVVLLDLKIPQPGGLTLLRYIRSMFPDTEVVVVTGYPTIENAKESIQMGAFDYLQKPLEPTSVRSVVSRALAYRRCTLQRRV